MCVAHGGPNVRMAQEFFHRDQIYPQFHPLFGPEVAQITKSYPFEPGCFAAPKERPPGIAPAVTLAELLQTHKGSR